MTEQQAREYIATVRWQWAKTYAKSWPHEYTVRKWRPELDQEFVAFARYVREHGRPEPFLDRTHIYLYLEGHKYWTMGAPVDETTVINRARLDGYT